MSRLAPEDALMRAQAVTMALSLGANTVSKGAKRVRGVLSRWIARLGTWLTGLKTTHNAAQVYLEVSVRGVTLGIAW